MPDYMPHIAISLYMFIIMYIAVCSMIFIESYEELVKINNMNTNNTNITELNIYYPYY